MLMFQFDLLLWKILSTVSGCRWCRTMWCNFIALTGQNTLSPNYQKKCICPKIEMNILCLSDKAEGETQMTGREKKKRKEERRNNTG